MLSLIQVRCPHCGAKGQIMLPPLGAIIVGPCPQCQELVVVFCGRVLPLRKDIMVEGSLDEKHQHLMSVLTTFIDDRVSKLLNEADAEEASEGAGEEEEYAEFEARGFEEEARTFSPEQPITQAQFDRFVNEDLKLIDNKDYFKAIFDT